MDAARRQLHTAIRLWFEDGDPVSIHTLASAAHEIIHALFRSKGLNGLLFDSPIVRPGKRPVWSGLLKTAANFFKHARHDDGALLDFHPGINEILLAACCKGIREVGSPASVEELAFTYWALFTQPESFDLGEARESFFQDRQVQALQKLVPKGRQAFFRKMDVDWKRGRITAGA